VTTERGDREPDAGLEFDRRLHAAVFGTGLPGETPAYSRDKSAALLLMRKVQQLHPSWDLRFAQSDEEWQCEWLELRAPVFDEGFSGADRLKRIAVATAPTISLAICRASWIAMARDAQDREPAAV